MLSNLDKKSKFMVLGGVAIVVTTGIVVGIAVPTARASNRNINGVAGNSNGADAGSVDAVPMVLNCPCFDGEDLDKAMSDISSGGGGFEFDTDKICAGNEDFDGMPYTEPGIGFPMPLGYTFDLRYELTCTELDAIHIISSDEATGCKSIMDAKCAEYSATLNALPTASSLVGQNTATCPCFTASELVSVLEDFTAGRITLDESSCSVDDELKISYGLPNGSGQSEYFAWGVGSFATDKTCIEDDMIHIITEVEWSACKAIVENSCALLP